MRKRHSPAILCIISALFLTAAVSLHGQTVVTTHNFTGFDGSYPLGNLVQGADGGYYGTTSKGGAGNPFGPGTVFELMPNGVLITLHNFNGNDGESPQYGLILASDGNFYGTTYQGGDDNYGVIFKITASGTFSILHSFSGGSDGRYPGQIIQASDGNFYGTAWGGGNDNCQTTGGCGVIFKVTPQGTFTKIYQFQGNTNDGLGPEGLVQGRDGDFYGMEQGWSVVLCSSNCGSVFKVTPSGSLTLLHTFNGQDGDYPSGQLLQTSDGTFYGTTEQGGTYAEGTVFKMTPSGALTSLYSFCHTSNCSDGSNPLAGLMQARDGTFYGTTAGGGTWGCTTCGTIFKITPNGSLTTLVSFDDRFYGGNPSGKLLQDASGNFYGLVSGGGANYYGTIFQFITWGKTLYTSISGEGSITSTDGNIHCPGSCTFIYSDNTPVMLNAVPTQGGVFAGWSGACSGNGSCNVVMSQDQMVTASFLPPYTLTVSTTGSGSVKSADGFINCPGVCSHVYAANTPVTLNNYPAQGWSFNSWSGACIGNNPVCYFSMTGDQTVTANFTQDSYTLTASISGQGTITSTDHFINCPGVCSHTYLSLTPVTLNATAANGWNFSGWSGACTGTGPCNLTMLGNTGASAYFMQPGSGLQFVPITPCRLIDTRANNGGGPIAGGTFRTFNLPQLAGAKGCGDLSSATAYSLNVTLATLNDAPVSYLTIWPDGLAQPVTSTMNSPDGRVKANAAIVPGGTDAGVSVYVSNTTNLILDINGYFAPPSSGTYQFYPLPPCRIIDTRNGHHGGTLQAGVERDYTIAGNCGVPPQATAYSFNVTAIPTQGSLDYLTVWPQGETMPVVSTLNDGTGTVVANAAIVPAGSNGKTAFYAHNHDTDLLLDVNGYFAAPGQSGLSMYPAPPCRVLDTRANNGQPFSGELTVNVVGSVCAPPANAEAYVFNATVVPPGPMGFLTLWPDGAQRPTVSTLNAYDGFITSNMAIVSTSNGSTDAYAAGLTQLILDISSYFAP